jgi:hypothetical protein
MKNLSYIREGSTKRVKRKAIIYGGFGENSFATGRKKSG